MASRDLLMIVFYVDVRGLPATMLEKRLEFWEKKYSMDFSRDIMKRYEIKTIFIPSMGETKVELLYPKVTQDTKEEKELLTMVNEIPLKEMGIDKPIPPPSQIIKEGEDSQDVTEITRYDEYRDKSPIGWWKKLLNENKIMQKRNQKFWGF